MDPVTILSRTNDLIPAPSSRQTTAASEQDRETLAVAAEALPTRQSGLKRLDRIGRLSTPPMPKRRRPGPIRTTVILALSRCHQWFHGTKMKD